MKSIAIVRRRGADAASTNPARRLGSAAGHAALVVLATVGVSLFGHDVATAYPPGSGVVTVEPDPAEVGQEVLVTVTCQDGETVSFALLSSTATDRCVAGQGPAAFVFTDVAEAGASGTVRVPVTPGDYDGSIVGSMTGSLGTFTVTVIDSNAFDFASSPVGLIVVEESLPIERLIAILAILLAGLGAIVAVIRMRPA